MQARSDHPLVHELVPTVPETDGRQADVFVHGMSIGHGLPVVGDMCMGSVLHANGRPYAEAAYQLRISSAGSRPAAKARRVANFLVKDTVSLAHRPCRSKLSATKSNGTRRRKCASNTG